MPNRSFRDTTKSEKINSISFKAEVFFYRLMMKADDFGNYYANAKILRSDLFPLKLDAVKESDISNWISECTEVGMIVQYSADGKNYLHILDFGQRMRFGSKNKFPAIPPEVAAGRGGSRPKEQVEIQDQIQVEDKVEVEIEGQVDAAVADEYSNFLLNFNTITGRDFKGGEKVKKSLRARLKEGYTLEDIGRATYNCFYDKYHQENPQYLTPEFILRQDKLDKYKNYEKPVIDINQKPLSIIDEMARKVSGIS